MDDPARTIEPHEFGDFRKELLQVLQEVKQEISNRENIDPIEDEEKPSMASHPFFKWEENLGSTIINLRKFWGHLLDFFFGNL